MHCWDTSEKLVIGEHPDWYFSIAHSISQLSCAFSYTLASFYSRFVNVPRKFLIELSLGWLNHAGPIMNKIQLERSMKYEMEHFQGLK